MIVPDANLLLYAYDITCPFRERARDWWEACLSGTEPVGLTHPKGGVIAVPLGAQPRELLETSRLRILLIRRTSRST